MEDDGLAQLQKLGARTVPIVSRGEKFVFAQVIKDVVEFLGLNDDTAPELSPVELAARYESILETAIRLTAQMPDARLADELPNRPRSWRVLMHHVFQIPTAFLNMEETGNELTYEDLVAPPPDDLKTSNQIAAFGTDLSIRFKSWWQSVQNEDFSGTVPTYFGGTSRHEMLERTVWHSTQHVRQIASLLEQVGVTPDQPLTPAHIQGLPLTDKVWDED